MNEVSSSVLPLKSSKWSFMLTLRCPQDWSCRLKLFLLLNSGTKWIDRKRNRIWITYYSFYH